MRQRRRARPLGNVVGRTPLCTPSRLTAEAPNREERARLLAAVTTRGFIDDYSGIRISNTGRRFRIAQATVWNLLMNVGASWRPGGDVFALGISLSLAPNRSSFPIVDRRRPTTRIPHGEDYPGRSACSRRCMSSFFPRPFRFTASWTSRCTSISAVRYSHADYPACRLTPPDTNAFAIPRHLCFAGIFADERNHPAAAMETTHGICPRQTHQPDGVLPE